MVETMAFIIFTFSYVCYDSFQTNIAYHFYFQCSKLTYKHILSHTIHLTTFSIVHVTVSRVLYAF